MKTHLSDRLLEVLSDELLEEINQRNRAPYLDRRSGEDKRARYSLSYFSEGGTERRVFKERRKRRSAEKALFALAPGQAWDRLSDGLISFHPELSSA